MYRGILMGIMAACMPLLAIAAGTPDLKERFSTALGMEKGRQVDQVNPTPLPGLYEVVIHGQVIYMSEDGRYIIDGTLIDYKGGPSNSINLTEKTRAKMRQGLMGKITDANTIVFGPKKAKYTLNVFTDTTCGYCRKLHQEVPMLNAKGVKVRYLLYPRAGEGSESAHTLESIWCSSNRQDALTKAKAGEEVPKKNCKNPVQEHLQLGQEFGLQGTPLLVTQNGTVINGYRPADDLVKMLESDTSN
jgi:thiol:disulfide interchange protein DsbC